MNARIEADYLRRVVRDALLRTGGRYRALTEARRQLDLAEDSLLTGDEDGAEIHLRRARVLAGVGA